MAAVRSRGKGADVSVGNAIPPGGAATVGEGAGATGVTPFAPGRYRYVVHVVRRPRPRPALDGSVLGAITEAEARDEFELRDEVQIR